MLIPSSSPLVTYKYACGTSAENVADDDLTNLLAYTLPANTVVNNGDAVYMTAFGKFGSDACDKNLSVYLTGYEDALRTFLIPGAENASWLITFSLVMRDAVSDLWALCTSFAIEGFTPLTQTTLCPAAVVNNFISNNLTFQVTGNSTEAGAIVQNALTAQVFRNPEQASVLTLP